MRKLLILPVLALLLLAACGKDDSPAVSSDKGATTTASSASDDYGYGDSTPTTGGAAVEGDTVKAVDYDFEPTELKVAKGTKVTFENTGDQPHTFTANDGSFDSGTVDPGKTFEHAFDQAGTFAFHCNFHSNMKGKVTVS